MAEIIAFRLDDVVRLRKPHPCGGFEWRIHRLGADIGLQCRTCGHYVMLPRTTLERRLKRFVSRGPEPEVASAAGAGLEAGGAPEPAVVSKVGAEPKSDGDGDHLS